MVIVWLHRLSKLWNVYLVNIIDIILVAYILYRLMLLIKGTRAVQMLVGTIVLLIATFLANKVFHFPTLGWLLNNFWVASVVVLVVVFQPELRAALAQLGSQRFSRFLIPTELEFVDQITAAVKECAKKKFGLLIVLEQDVGLRNYVATGTTLNSEISKELILTIFHPKTPLHDGAIIVQNTRLVAAGCVLPLTTETAVAQVLGMRHRAAIGITEISDSWAIVVSEETGKISLARNGGLEQDVTIMDLQERLYNLYRSRQMYVPLWQRVRRSVTESK